MSTYAASISWVRAAESTSQPNAASPTQAVGHPSCISSRTSPPRCRMHTNQVSARPQIIALRAHPGIDRGVAFHRRREAKHVIHHQGGAGQCVSPYMIALTPSLYASFESSMGRKPRPDHSQNWEMSVL